MHFNKSQFGSLFRRSRGRQKLQELNYQNKRDTTKSFQDWFNHFAILIWTIASQARQSPSFGTKEKQIHAHPQ